ncbi:beta-microseminoprotein-like isoform X2 [Sardina pilchardus]|uniref:beta-microseminoprotein-like isoform X1 n=1 Tax=Sardina pilchardus TaxID=27697 RepID=UPI002E0FE13A
MRSVAALLIVCCLVPLAYTACYREMAKIDIEQPGLRFCEDSWDNTQHRVGTNWVNSGCQSCSCGAGGMECCDRMARPSGYPADCEVLYDWKECTYEVVKKNDPSITCPHSAVGK